jgi:hypothetical protein
VGGPGRAYTRRVVAALPWSGLVLSVALGATGCSLIYDADDLSPRPPIDAGPDAPIDALVNDANVTALRLTAIDPEAIDEGSGAGGSRPAIVVIEGSDIEASLATASVAFEGAAPDTPPTVVEAVVEPTMGRIVVALTVPVLPALRQGQTATLNVTVTQAGTSATIPLTVTGLDELEPGKAVPSFDTDDLEDRYSRVRLGQNVTFTGDKPAFIRSVTDIDIEAAVRVNASGQTPGPGGCPGGSSSSDAGCGNGRGRPGGGAVSAGGGGGGFGTEGEAGRSGVAGSEGPGGDAVGDAMLSQLVYDGSSEGNRGSGGGAGGGLLTGGSGGPGGGGGGTIALSAGGSIRVSASGAVSASGGNGSVGGGGGSGGAVLVRAVGALDARDEWINTGGGAGSGSGGDGGDGRVRIDAPAGDVGDMAVEAVAARGPAWGPDQKVITRDAMQALAVKGGPGAQHGVELNGEAAGTVLLDGNGAATVRRRLEAGRNVVCLVANPGAQVIRDENRSCLTIGYVP